MSHLDSSSKSDPSRDNDQWTGTQAGTCLCTRNSKGVAVRAGDLGERDG